MSEPLRQSRLSEAGVGLSTGSEPVARKKPINDRAEPATLRPSRLAETTTGLGVPLKESRLSSKMDIPAVRPFDSEKQPMLAEPSQPSRIRDKTPSISPLDPEPAIAAMMVARQEKAKAIENRRKTKGIRNGITISQLSNQQN